MSVTVRWAASANLPVSRPVLKAAVSTLLYVGLCVPYILFSGHLAALASRSSEELRLLETLKGVAFVLATGGLYFAVSRARWRTIQGQEQQLLAQGRSLLLAERRIVAGTLSAALAHDLNNLLMALGGLLQEQRGGAAANPFSSAVHLQEQLEQAIGRLSRLCERISSASRRVEAEEPHERVDLREALEELVSAVQRHPDLRFCTISILGPPGTDPAPRLAAELNRTLFEEAVANLLINAGQAAGPGGRIEVTLHAEQGAAVISVADNGPGVPEGHLEEVFEPWFTTKPEGTGLGLVSVKAFALSCAGEVSVGRSSLGGALFRLRIPLATGAFPETSAVGRGVGCTPR